jgi:hypothetical protein
MNPLQPQHFVTLEGVAYPLRFELFDWATAEKNLKVPLLPFGAQKFWSEPGMYQNAVLLFVGLHRSIPDLTLEWLTDRVTWENYVEVSNILQAALSDFFLRLGVKVPEETTPAPPTDEIIGPISGDSEDMTSGSQTPSSGA